ncbi:MAG: hypothetical protein ACM309_03885 [Bacillota bacterium]
MAGPGRGIHSLAAWRGAAITVVALTTAAAATAAALVVGCDGACACVGARPLAMGGAFIAVADDSSAVYWNPAGLAGLTRRQLALTSTLNNRTTFNYDDFLAYVEPGPGPGTGAGLGFVTEHVGSLEGEGAYRASRWLVCSVGRPVSRDLALGANLRYETHARRLPGSGLVLGSRWGIDLALLYRLMPGVSLGLLLQDSGLSPIRWEDGQEEAVRVNVRPGFAYRPDSRTVIAVDLYDLGALVSGPPEAGSSTFAVRAGVERRVSGHLAARLGYYGISPEVGAITCGAGWREDEWQVDYAYLGAATTPGHPGLGGTHQIGVTFKF